MSSDSTIGEPGEPSAHALAIARSRHEDRCSDEFRCIDDKPSKVTQKGCNWHIQRAAIEIECRLRAGEEMVESEYL